MPPSWRHSQKELCHFNQLLFAPCDLDQVVCPPGEWTTGPKLRLPASTRELFCPSGRRFSAGYPLPLQVANPLGYVGDLCSFASWFRLLVFYSVSQRNSVKYEFGISKTPSDNSAPSGEFTRVRPH